MSLKPPATTWMNDVHRPPTQYFISPLWAPAAVEGWGTRNQVDENDLKDLEAKQVVRFSVQDIPEQSQCSCLKAVGQEQCTIPQHYVMIVGTSDAHPQSSMKYKVLMKGSTTFLECQLE
jgi:hypothetical protein